MDPTRSRSDSGWYFLACHQGFWIDLWTPGEIDIFDRGLRQGSGKVTPPPGYRRLFAQRIVTSVTSM